MKIKCSKKGLFSDGYVAPTARLVQTRMTASVLTASGNVSIQNANEEEWIVE